ncbi:hypothetical protein VFPPC_17759 [Pochonia chlamydosporia 170]|uniref:Uncharacterized protein n=1 Tax=Pochonia chlamydosporia 170 TaxID=1380566 RepID=A0A219AS80_METCM|nr:hypothetical protein VFPPC_17759 [Pochonia chlamydosporia 170]OWT43065.1 hypothetical protein VFPPC_17759 [Pochonia chlamydosporia 170]
MTIKKRTAKESPPQSRQLLKLTFHPQDSHFELAAWLTLVSWDISIGQTGTSSLVT